MKSILPGVLHRVSYAALFLAWTFALAGREVDSVPLAEGHTVQLTGYNVACFDAASLDDLFDPDNGNKAIPAIVDWHIERGRCAAIRPGVYRYISKTDTYHYIRYGAFRLFVLNPSVATVKLNRKRGRRETAGILFHAVGEIRLEAFHVACHESRAMKAVIGAAKDQNPEFIRQTLDAGSCAVLAPGVYLYTIEEPQLIRVRHEGFRLWMAAPDATEITLDDATGRKELQGD